MNSSVNTVISMPRSLAATMILSSMSVIFPRVSHFGVKRLEHPKQGVKHNHWTSIPNVHEVVDGRSTNVHLDVIRIYRGKNALFGPFAIGQT